MPALRYFAQKGSDGYPLPGTLMGFTKAPAAKNLVEILPQTYAAGVGQKVKPAASGLRYFVRRQPDGSIRPGSLLTASRPPSGSFYEYRLIVAA